MPFVVELKERLSATQDTQKITQSLQLVAANKMKGFVKKALSVRAYAWNLLDILAGFENEQEMFSSNFFVPINEDAPALFILVTSDKGLCGSLNQKIIRYLFDSSRFLSEKKPQIVTIGKKAAEAVRKKGIEPILTFEGVKENLTPYESLAIIEPIIKLWTEGVCSKVYLISPHYINPFLSHPTIKTYLPLSKGMATSHFNHRVQKPSLSEEYVAYEPSKNTIVDKLERMIVEAIFLQAFYELKASEYSSRMVAMKKATESSSEVIEFLKLELNKVRQGVITQQLSELATASEAMEEEDLGQINKK